MDVGRRRGESRRAGRRRVYRGRRPHHWSGLESPGGTSHEDTRLPKEAHKQDDEHGCSSVAGGTDAGRRRVCPGRRPHVWSDLRNPGAPRHQDTRLPKEAHKQEVYPGRRPHPWSEMASPWMDEPRGHYKRKKSPRNLHGLTIQRMAIVKRWRMGSVRLICPSALPSRLQGQCDQIERSGRSLRRYVNR